MDTQPVLATEVKIGDTILTWFGLRTVYEIEPYEGTLPAEGIARFTDDTGMTIFCGDMWEMRVSSLV